MMIMKVWGVFARVPALIGTGESLKAVYTHELTAIRIAAAKPGLIARALEIRRDGPCPQCHAEPWEHHVRSCNWPCAICEVYGTESHDRPAELAGSTMDPGPAVPDGSAVNDGSAVVAGNTVEEGPGHVPG